MSSTTMNFLILLLFVLDIIIVAFFISFLRKLRYFNKGKSFNDIIRMFNAFLADTDNVAGRFKEQLDEKHRLIRSLNEQLDKRIMNLSLLLNRAEALQALNDQETEDNNGDGPSLSNKYSEIIALANKGRGHEEIAELLSIPKGEVKLVLNLKEAIAGRACKQGAH
ncbi:MAG: hypothetical protein JRJ79_04710 [Deltaproteobacteria bacterium]|nr:hypothetical protein [Deltaproteobacteria bacterium]